MNRLVVFVFDFADEGLSRDVCCFFRRRHIDGSVLLAAAFVFRERFPGQDDPDRLAFCCRYGLGFKFRRGDRFGRWRRTFGSIFRVRESAAAIPPAARASSPAIAAVVTGTVALTLTLTVTLAIKGRAFTLTFCGSGTFDRRGRGGFSGWKRRRLGRASLTMEIAFARRTLLARDLVEVLVFFKEIGDVEKRVSFQAEIDEGRLHSWQNARHAAFMNAARERILVSALEINLDELIVFEKRNPGLVPIGRDH